jgi:hypothetical protein
MERSWEHPERNFSILKCILVFLVIAVSAAFVEAQADQAVVEQWDIFELALQGPQNGNPFLDVQLRARFTCTDRIIEVNGFYDGDGTYRIRFMPDVVGQWRYVTQSSEAGLDGKKGAFACQAPGPDNHGPVRVNNQYHFAYADGTAYYPFGTTCYAWIHQGEALEEQTLKTLKTASFNKLRMCVFPKNYSYNQNEPQYYPFAGSAPKDWDFTRYNPAFFRHLEKRVANLRDLGIEADIILFHPYDRWGFSEMDAESDYRYLKYICARLSAYRNVWWSMANEYDFLLKRKPMSQWDRFFEILRDNDPYGHLRSIHNGDVEKNYDHTKPWITHVCIQNWDVKRAREWRKAYLKPVINDECEYEGNIPMPWGNISARELVHRFWIMCTNGCYAGHGETYEHPEQILWWSKGGSLVGESWQRVLFLKEIMQQGPPGGLTPIGDFWIWSRVSGGMNSDYRLIYFGAHQPKIWFYGKPKQGRFKVDVIDTWNMTVTPQQRIYAHNEEIPLPGKPYLAIRIRPVK